MAIQKNVEFVTLGDAAEMLGTPAPTLRGWADKLEELGVHQLERNHRQERIFYDTDLEIFRFIKDQKDVHGRKSTTEDLARLVLEMAERDGLFQLRRIEGMRYPPAEPAPQLTYVDMERLLSQETFKEWFEQLHKELNKETLQKMQKMENELQKLKEESNDKLDKLLEQQEKRDRELMSYIKRSMEIRKYESLPFYKKWFTKPPDVDA